MSIEYWNTKGINPEDEEGELAESDKIRLGEQRRPSKDFQQDRLNRSHERSMMGTQEITQNNYGSGNTVKPWHKESSDPFPHQCRFYKGCEELITNPMHNLAHFGECHPLTISEKAFYFKVYLQSKTGKQLYELSILFGRSLDQVKEIICDLLGVKQLSEDPEFKRWSHRAKEIEPTNERIRYNRAEIKYEYKQWMDNIENPSVDTVEEQLEFTLVDRNNAPLINNYYSIPQDIEEIQSQNYLSRPTNLTDDFDIISQIQSIINQYNELKIWKASAEQREKEYIQEIEELRTHASRLDVLINSFNTSYRELIVSHQNLEE